MSHDTNDDARQAKQQMRAEAAARRANQPDAQRLSEVIFGRLAALPAYANAQTVMLYLDIRDEVRTRWFVPAAWGQGKRVVVPYCNGNRLGLFPLDDFAELAPGALGILEPRRELRGLPDKQVAPGELDLIVAPGVAFDRRGGRLGYGKGYYDKLLEQIRGDATKLAVCFECQLVDEVPSLPHDVRMDLIVTETAVYTARAE